VGDEARSFSQALGGGKENEGVVAVKGSRSDAIVATDTPASLAQVEALINQLLQGMVECRVRDNEIVCVQLYSGRDDPEEGIGGLRRGRCGDDLARGVRR
jgi:hypothetical protein